MNIIDLATKAMQTAIKSVVDATKTKVDTIDTRTTTINTNVSTVDTNLTNTKSVVDATKSKVDAIDNRTTTMSTNIDTLLAGRIVKSVQRGITSVSNTAITSITISAINDKKAIMVIGTAGGTSYFRARIENSTTLSFSRSGSGETDISWQVIEFY